MATPTTVAVAEKSSALPLTASEHQSFSFNNQLHPNRPPPPQNNFLPRGNRRGGRGRGSFQQGAHPPARFNNLPESFPVNLNAVKNYQNEFQHSEDPRHRVATSKRARGQSGSFNQSINQPYFDGYSQEFYSSRGHQHNGHFTALQGISGRGRGGSNRGRVEQPQYEEDNWQRGGPGPRGAVVKGSDSVNGQRVELPIVGLGSQDVRRNVGRGGTNGNGGRAAVQQENRAPRGQGRPDFNDENVAPRNVATRSAPSQGGRLRTVKVEDQNQRERLTEELTKEKLECQFCYECIWSKQPTWSCEGCYNVFHLKCLRSWAATCKNESQDGTWRCMICQLILLEEPRQYLCFCRKQDNPEWNPNVTPHSCGQVCGKGSAKGNAGLGCEHPCVCLCHPGPCPPCQRQVGKACGCGKTQIHDQCSSTSSHVCSNTCEKALNCGNHTCPQVCHVGPCTDCAVSVEKSCYCRREVRPLSCLQSTEPQIRLGFACASVCGAKLTCGNHFCQKICHSGECSPCVRSPALVKKCPCGKHSLQELGLVRERRSCLEPIVGCGETCAKVLACGTAKSPHFCEMECHDGPCLPCGKKTAVNCSCGSSTQVVACADLTGEIRQWKCPKRCQKKMLCGRHKCENVCCNYDEHVCWKQCQKKLTCGLHACEDPCGHPGGCRRCLNTSFEERTCRCGATVQQPPIPCGAPLPECRRPCSLEHPCGHPPTHSCHGEARCPPCTFLCEKNCFGGHEERRNIPCHVQGLSCGKTCMKELCGVHFCQKKCHAGDCQVAGEKCQQMCTLIYRKCGHSCNVVCHGRTKCPITLCKSVLEVTCECQLRKEKVVCHQHEKLLKEYLKRKQLQETGGLKLLKLDDLRYAMPTDVLECDEECRKIERNKSLATALNIDPDADTSSVIGLPVYEEALKQTARENIRWATQMENSIMSLVKIVRETGSAKRVHQLQPMKHEQRKFIHELAGFYGCQTQSFDQEPMRTVVLIAKFDSVQTPSTPLFQVVAAERPAKQTAKCPARNALSSGVSANCVDKSDKFTWPVELPVFEEKRTFNHSSAPTVDYFDATD